MIRGSNPRGPATFKVQTFINAITLFMPRKGLSKYGGYEGDPTVACWRANLARGSPITAEWPLGG